MEPLEIGLITKYLSDEGYMNREFGVLPTKKYKVKQLPPVLDYIEKNPFEYNKEDIARLIPTLFKSYMKAGAKINQEPAIDREFHCIDFLTMLEVDTMSNLFKTKYLAKSAPVVDDRPSEHLKTVMPAGELVETYSKHRA